MNSFIKIGFFCTAVLACGQCTSDATSTGEPKAAAAETPQHKAAPQPHPRTVKLADCINEKNGNDTRTHRYAAPVLVAHPRVLRRDRQQFVHGMIGYHTTWSIYVDLDGRPPTAYETYGELDKSVRVVGRGPVPEPVVRAVKSCGFAWNGNDSRSIYSNTVQALMGASTPEEPE